MEDLVKTTIDPDTLRPFADDLRQLSSAIEKFEQSLSACGLQKEEKPRVLSRLGYYYSLKGRYGDARKALEAACLLFEDLGDRQGLLVARIRLATALQWAGDFQLADQLFTDSIVEADRHSPLRNWLDFARQHYGKCLFEQSKFEAALEQFELALGLRQIKGDKELIASTELAIGRVRRELAKMVSLADYRSRK